MASFTDNFFSNTKTTIKSNTNSKKKKDDEDELYTSFTESFFNNSYDEYYKSAEISQYDDNTVYSDEFINEYNSFIDRMNKGAKERYNEQVAKTESAAMYYSANKNKLVEDRNKNLIYNWNIDDSGGLYFDYGAVPKQDKNGYLKVNLCYNGKDKIIRVHRLVTEAFIPNPDNLPEVNHKDEDKTNNRVENLEWCDRSYNINYGTRKDKVRDTKIKNGCWTGLSKEEYKNIILKRKNKYKIMLNY